MGIKSKNKLKRVHSFRNKKFDLESSEGQIKIEETDIKH
jgi:hypothetical protein